MGILAIGTVGYDSVQTPVTGGKDLLGGSATYFSISASYFAPVSLVAVVGEDFSRLHRDLLHSHGIQTSGLMVSSGKTFRWSAQYSKDDINSRRTLDTQLNVLASFQPQLGPQERQQEYLFLANIDPELQLDVLGQMSQRPKVVALDTMDFWINSKREALTQVIQSADIVFMDEGEIRLFAGEANLVRAAKKILSLGPQTVIAKRGEHGILQLTREWLFSAPAYPLEQVVDPTGAGDSFAGGFMGYLAATGDTSMVGQRRAAVLGSVMGSFAVESLSVERIHSLTFRDLTTRFGDFARLTHFDALKDGERLPWLESPTSVQRDPKPGKEHTNIAR